MATNVYDREELVFFDSSRPSHYYGWHVSTTSGDFAISGFCSKKIRDEFLVEIQHLLTERQIKAIAEYVGPLAFAMNVGEESEWAEELLKRELAEDFPEAEVDDFCEEQLFPICTKHNERDDAERLQQLQARDKAPARDKGNKRSPKLTKGNHVR